MKGISELYRQAVEEAEIAKTIMKVLKSSVPRGAMHIMVRVFEREARDFQ